MMITYNDLKILLDTILDPLEDKDHQYISWLTPGEKLAIGVLGKVRDFLLSKGVIGENIADVQNREANTNILIFLKIYFAIYSENLIFNQNVNFARLEDHGFITWLHNFEQLRETLRKYPVSFLKSTYNNSRIAYAGKEYIFFQKISMYMGEVLLPECFSMSSAERDIILKIEDFDILLAMYVYKVYTLAQISEQDILKALAKLVTSVEQLNKLYFRLYKQFPEPADFQNLQTIGEGPYALQEVIRKLPVSHYQEFVPKILALLVKEQRKMFYVNVFTHHLTAEKKIQLVQSLASDPNFSKMIALAEPSDISNFLGYIPPQAWSSLGPVFVQNQEKINAILNKFSGRTRDQIIKIIEGQLLLDRVIGTQALDHAEQENVAIEVQQGSSSQELQLKKSKHFSAAQVYVLGEQPEKAIATPLIACATWSNINHRKAKENDEEENVDQKDNTFGR